MHVAVPEVSTTRSKLIPFVYDTATRYVVQVTNTDISVWRTDGTLAWSAPFNGGIPGLAHWPTLTGVDVDAISYAQVNDVLFLVHPSMPPLTLQRVADDDWKRTSITSSMGLGKNYWPAVLDEAVTSFVGADVAEGRTIQKATAISQTYTFGGAYFMAPGGPIDSAPCPAFWRLYTGTTSFTGTIVIKGCDTPNGTYRTLYTITNASVGAMTKRQEWYHAYAYMQVVVTRSAGTATFEIRHVGSLSAPTMWMEYFPDLFPPPGTFGSPGTVLRASPGLAADVAAGEQIQLEHKRMNQQVEITVAATATDEFKVSDEIYILGKWEVYTVGIWKADLYVEAKESTGAWRTIRHLKSNKDQNFSIAGESDGETLRIRVDKWDAAASSSAAVPRFVLASVDGVASQYVTAFYDADAGDSFVRVSLMDGYDEKLIVQATTAVSRGAFSPSEGYPSAVCIHDQRVYFGGTRKRPTTIWASSVNDLFNFRRTGFDDGGFMFEIASNEGNPIQWMLPASRGILLGTAGDEWLLDGADTGITPTNIMARRQSRIGAASLQAISAAGSTIFVQRGSMHLQEYQFAWETQQFQAVDLTELVKHLTPSGIRAIAFSQNPEPMLWCVMLDGSLLSCTYNRAQEVIAWAKHTTDGAFESVCVTYGDTANADDVWFIVNRYGTRRLEKFDVSFWAGLYNDGPLYHCDASVVKSGTAFTSVTGLSHLEGKTVKVLANGLAIADKVVTSGSVTVPAGTTHAVVGLGFDSELQPMPFDIQLQTGTSQGRKMHTPAFAARLYRTDAAKYADSLNAALYDMKITPDTTGLVRLANVGRMNDSCEVYFRSVGALPLNLVCVVPSVNVYGE